MDSLVKLTGIARSPGDPKIQQTGASSLSSVDSLARALGWFSLALGLTELLAPRRVTRALGMEGREGLVRAYGARELAGAIPTLSVDKHVGLASRVAGDVMDIATLLPALRSGNPKRGNALLALTAVAAVTFVDIVAMSAVLNTHRRNRGQVRDYSARSGLPLGSQASRGLARKHVATAADIRTAA